MASPIQWTDPETINFVRVCRITLDHIPLVLREYFKYKINQRLPSAQQWQDTPKWGAWLESRERWRSKLTSDVLFALQSGNTTKWDPTILFHVLLYSSHCLLVTNILPSSQVELTNGSKLVKSTVNTADFCKLFQTGDVVLFDFQHDMFRGVVDRRVRKLDFHLKKAFSGPATVRADIYKCGPEWLAVEELSWLRNRQFGHLPAAKTTANKLTLFIQQVEGIYKVLRVPAKFTQLMQAIIKEPVAEQQVVKMVEHYKELWKKEEQHWLQMRASLSTVEEDITALSADISVVKTDLPHLKTSVEAVKEEIKALSSVDQQTTKEVAKMKLGQSEVQSALSSLTHQVSKVTTDSKKAKGKLEELSRQIQVVNRKQAERAESVEKKQQTLERKFSQTESKVEETIRRDRDKIFQDLQIIRQDSASKEVVVSIEKQLVSTTKALEVVQDDVTTLQRNCLAQEGDMKLFKFLTPSFFKADIDFHAARFHLTTRMWILNDIETWLHTSELNDSRISLLTANPGMGKSVIAAVICTRSQEEDSLAAAFFFQHGKLRRNNPRLMIQTLAYQLSHTIPEYKYELLKMVSSLELAEMGIADLFCTLLLEPLSQIPCPESNKLLVIDAIDECESEILQLLLNLIVREFLKLPPWLFVFITARPLKKIMRKLNHIHPKYELIASDQRNQNDLCVYARNALASKVSGEELPQAIELLVKRSRGVFIYLHYLCTTFEIYSHLTLSQVLSLTPEGIDDYYEQNFQRLYLSIGKSTYLTLLSCIAAAPANLPQQLLRYVLSDNCSIQEVIQKISVMFPIQNDCVTVFHQSVLEWLVDSDRAQEYVVTVDCGHKTLAATCKQTVSKLISACAPPEEVTKYPENRYAFEYMIFHSCEGKCNLKLLTHLLCNLQFMFYRISISSGNIQELLDDFSKVKSSITSESAEWQIIASCDQFLRIHGDVVSDSPALIFQCALNESKQISELFEIQKYQSNPSLYFHGLQAYVEVIQAPKEHAHLPSHTVPPDALLTKYTASSTITHFCQSRDGIYLACGCRDNSVNIWNVETLELKRYEEEREFGPFSYIKFCSISVEGLISYGNVQQALTVNCEIVPLLPHKMIDVDSAIFSPDGGKLLAWSKIRFPESSVITYPLKVIFLQAKKITEVFSDHAYCCTVHANWSPCGSRIVSGHADGTLRVWDVEEEEIIASIECPLGKGDLGKCLYSPNGHYIAVSYGSDIVLRDAITFSILQELKFPGVPQTLVVSVAFSDDSKSILAITQSGLLRMWTLLKSGQCSSSSQFLLEYHFQFPYLSLDCCAFVSLRNDKIIVARGNFLEVYNVEILSEVGKRALTKEDEVHTGLILCYSHIPHTNVVVSSGDEAITFWDGSTGYHLITDHGDFEMHTSSPFGSLLATCGGDYQIMVWDTTTLTLVASIAPLPCMEQCKNEDYTVHENEAVQVCHIVDTGKVACGCKSGNVYLWQHYGNSNTITVGTFHTSSVEALSFSPTGDCFVSGDLKGAVAMWKLSEDSKLQVFALESHQETVQYICFSPDIEYCPRFVSAGWGPELYLHNCKDGNLLQKMAGHKSDIFVVKFSASGSIIASADSDEGLVCLWDSFTGVLLSKVPGSGRGISTINFISSDHLLVVSDFNNMVRVYRNYTQNLQTIAKVVLPDLMGCTNASKNADDPIIACFFSSGLLKVIKIRECT